MTISTVYPLSTDGIYSTEVYNTAVTQKKVGYRSKITHYLFWVSIKNAIFASDINV